MIRHYLAKTIIMVLKESSVWIFPEAPVNERIECSEFSFSPKHSEVIDELHVQTAFYHQNAAQSFKSTCLNFRVQKPAIGTRKAKKDCMWTSSREQRFPIGKQSACVMVHSKALRFYLLEYQPQTTRL